MRTKRPLHTSKVTKLRIAKKKKNPEKTPWIKTIPFLREEARGKKLLKGQVKKKLRALCTRSVTETSFLQTLNGTLLTGKEEVCQKKSGGLLFADRKALKKRERERSSCNFLKRRGKQRRNCQKFRLNSLARRELGGGLLCRDQFTLSGVHANTTACVCVPPTLTRNKASTCDGRNKVSGRQLGQLASQVLLPEAQPTEKTFSPAFKSWKSHPVLARMVEEWTSPRMFYLFFIYY